MGQALSVGGEMGGMAALTTGIGGVAMAFINDFSNGVEYDDVSTSTVRNGTEEEHQRGLKLADKYNSSDNPAADQRKFDKLWAGRPSSLEDVENFSSGHYVGVPKGWGLTDDDYLIGPKKYKYIVVEAVSLSNDDDPTGRMDTYFSPHSLRAYTPQINFNGLIVHEMTHSYDFHYSYSLLNSPWDGEASEAAAVQTQYHYYQIENYNMGMNALKRHYGEYLNMSPISGYIPNWFIK